MLSTFDRGRCPGDIFLAILADACVGRLGREAVASACIGKLEGTEKMGPWYRTRLAYDVPRCSRVNWIVFVVVFALRCVLCVTAHCAKRTDSYVLCLHLNKEVHGWKCTAGARLHIWYEHVVRTYQVLREVTLISGVLMHERMLVILTSIAHNL